MAVAFGFSSYAGTSIFVANSPEINRHYLTDLRDKFNKNLNNVYMAFSFMKRKDVAFAFPTWVPRTNNMNGVAKINPVKPTFIPYVTKASGKPSLANVDPATIPANLFESVAKGVSAYESGNETIFKVDKGTKYTVRKLQLSNGKTIDVIDFDGP